jgi:hypothetical protein
MSQARALKTMVRVYTRRGQRLEDAQRAARQALAEREAEHVQAQQARAAHEQAEQAGQNQRDGLMGRCFTPEQLLSMDLYVQQLAAHTASTAQAVQQAAQQVGQQQGVLAQKQSDLRRNTQRVHVFGQELTQLAAAAAADIEENSEEESSDGYAARLVARRLAQAQEQAQEGS